MIRINNYNYKSKSDCEVILPLFLMYVSNDGYLTNKDNKNMYTFGMYTNQRFSNY